MSTTIKKRLDYIDATKGVAILCITFLHFEQGVIPAWLNTWIGLFMISAFYVTSGWVSGISNRSLRPKELLKKRIKQLGVPYLWFSLLIIAFDTLWVLLGFMEKGILLRDIYKTIVLRGIGTLWFLPVLVIGEYIFALIRNTKRFWLWGVIGLAITLVVNFVYNTYWLPISENSELHRIIDAPMQPIVRGLYAWPIIAIGFIVAKRWGYQIMKENKMKLFAISALLFAISILLVVEPTFNIYYISGVLNNTLPAIAFMCLFVVFSRNMITSFFSYWGVNSLILMCTHFSITMEIMKTFDRMVLHCHTFEGPRTLIYFATAVLLTYPMVFLFNGPLKFMIGK